jgi:hypothetical protein
MAGGEYKLVGAITDTSYQDKLAADAKKKERGIYPRTILIGLGGSGSKVLLHVRRLMLERFGAADALEGVAFLSIDTDIQSQTVAADQESKSLLDRSLAFEKDERVNLKVDFKSFVGANIVHHAHIREWWDESALPSADFNLEQGAGQIRPLARLAFFTNRAAIQGALARAYTKVSSNRITGDRVDMTSSVRVVIVAGLAGGTGSGLILDLPALVQHELQARERPIVEGFFVLPGGFRTVEKETSYPKLAANGYAALRELNHYLTHPFRVQWEANGPQVEIQGLYNRHVLFSGTNASNEQLADLNDCYRILGEALFLDFGAGPMSGWIQGVRVNREQYLRSAVTYTYRIQQADGSPLETHTDQWRNAFSSLGFAKLVFPSWRLINQAKYDLAASMVALLDPGRVGSMPDVITRHRQRFLFEAGVLQGELETEDGVQPHKQIETRLAQQSGAGPEVLSIEEHLRRLQGELLKDAESMYVEGTTLADCDTLWKRVQNYWGDPASPGADGDWAKKVRENRVALAKEVHRRLPGVIEDFRQKPAVGITGLVAILRDVLEHFKRPDGQAYYLDYFQQRRARLVDRIESLLETWRQRRVHADEAGRGFGRTQQAHRVAVERAGDALVDYWLGRAKLLIFEEAEKVLAEVGKSMSDQLARIEQISQRMSQLESQYRELGDAYARPQPSFVLLELEAGSSSSGLLEPYLGRQPEERNRRLERLLERGLRQMGLDSLEAIGTKLTGEFEDLRDNLAAQAFYALRGENGRATAFVDNPDDAPEGFIERHSILRVLRETRDADKRRELFEQLYRKALPWARKNQSQALIHLQEPHPDAFVGFITGAEVDIAGELMERLRKLEERGFAAREVRSYDPSEILLYTELTAFPVYFLSEISGLKDHYDQLAGDRSRRTPLHIHQDHHRFQPIVPFSASQVEDLQRAWIQFLQAQILGLLCSTRQRGDNEGRAIFQLRRKAGAHEYQWSDLGPEAQVIQALMNDRNLSSTLQQSLEQEVNRATALTEGSYVPLIALADYYYYCIFPVRRGLLAGESGPLGSIENLAAARLRSNWREKDRDSEAQDGEVKRALELLAQWAKPIYRERGGLVPRTPQLGALDRLEEWTLSGLAEKAVRELISTRQLDESRDSQGQITLTFPRLALLWEKLGTEGLLSQLQQSVGPSQEPPLLVEPTVVAGLLYHYARDRERLGQRSVAEIVREVVGHPASEHQVWHSSFGGAWRAARDVPAIAKELETEPPPLEGPGAP